MKPYFTELKLEFARDVIAYADYQYDFYDRAHEYGGPKYDQPSATYTRYATDRGYGAELGSAPTLQAPNDNISRIMPQGTYVEVSSYLQSSSLSQSAIDCRAVRVFKNSFTNSIHVRMDGTTFIGSAYSTSVVDANQIKTHTIVVKWASSSAAVWIDGVLAASGSCPANPEFDYLGWRDRPNYQISNTVHPVLLYVTRQVLDDSMCLSLSSNPFGILKPARSRMLDVATWAGAAAVTTNRRRRFFMGAAA